MHDDRNRRQHRLRHDAESTRRGQPALPATKSPRAAAAAALTCGLLVASGVAYRVVAEALGSAVAETIRLPQPLSTLPLTMGPWRGEDVPIPETTLRVAGNDDYVSRRYRDAAADREVYLYVAYTGRPRTMLGHRPTVCYPSAGWLHESTEKSYFQGPAGPLSCMIHVFSYPKSIVPRQVVLNFYMLNGHAAADESAFSGFGWRDPNLSRDASRYVAQIEIVAQVGSDVAAAQDRLRAFAESSVPGILRLLPDTNVTK